MKHGFTLIELLISMAIASLLGMILFAAFWQTNSMARRITSVTSIYERGVSTLQLLEKDFSGACIPFQAQKKRTDEKKQTDKPEQPAPPQEKTVKPITKIFYATMDHDMPALVTFMSNNPAHGLISPVRIVYRIEPEETRSAKPSYRLLRQESTNLDFDLFKPDAQQPIARHEVVGFIKNISFIYTAEFVKEVTEKKETEETKTIEKTYSTAKVWDLEQQQTQDQKKETQEKKQVIIPYAVDITLELWDELKQRTHSFTYKVRILPEHDEYEQEKQTRAAPAPEQPETPKTSVAQARTPEDTLRDTVHLIKKFIKNPEQPQAPKVTA